MASEAVKLGRMSAVLWTIKLFRHFFKGKEYRETQKEGKWSETASAKSIQCAVTRISWNAASQNTEKKKDKY